jgi:hypothetical protein
MHCGSSTSKLMSKFLLMCSIFNVMVLPICVCGVVSELSIISSFLCLLKENQLLLIIKIDQQFLCLLFLSIVSLSLFKYCPSTLSWLFYFQAIISKSTSVPINEILAPGFLGPTIVFILTGLLGVSASYSPTRPLYLTFCVHLLKSTP